MSAGYRGEAGRNTLGEGVQAPTRESEIEGLLNRLAGGTEELMNLLDALRAKIKPVLEAVPESPHVNKDGAERATLSPLGGALMGSILRVEAMIRVARETANRVAL